MTHKVITPLAPDGFPWRAALVGVGVTLVGAATVLYGFGFPSTGGAVVVSALFGNAVFAAMLG